MGRTSTPQPPPAEPIDPDLYDDLRRLASHRLRGSSVHARCQTTELVHEAVVRIRARTPSAQDATELFLLAARTMRNVIIDLARRQGTELKHLETVARFNAPGSAPGLDQREEILRLDAALNRLQEAHPRPAEVVSLRYFGGLSTEQIADCLGVSERTVRREWNFARAWLHEWIDANPG